MCLICWEFQRGLMTKQEALNNLTEVTPSTEAAKKHVANLLKQLNETEITKELELTDR